MRRGALEKKLLAEGRLLVGIDEVGRGCIAGPVYTACVSLDYHRLFKLRASERALIRDSKKLSTKQRQDILGVIHTIAIEAHVGISSAREVERYGIVEAIFLAMRRALNQCRTPHDLLLVDGNQEVTGHSGEQLTIVEGDYYCYAIAAASIIAKEARDDFMREQALVYPNFGFENHVGYSTREHLEKIEAHGICPLHRKNFAPITRQLRPEPPVPMFADTEAKTL